MAVITTSVQICNMALARLGQKGAITSLDASDVVSALCKQFYDITRVELIASYRWHFALDRALLAALSGDNLTIYTYKYQLPMDPLCLKVWNLINAAEETYEDLKAEWMVEGTVLYTDQTPAAMKYNKDITQVAQLPKLFVEAFALRLATKMCMKLTQDIQLFTVIAQEFAIAMENAKQQEGSWSRQEDAANDWW